MSREGEKFTGILLMVQLNPVPVFGAPKKHQYHLTEIFHRNCRTNGKRSFLSESDKANSFRSLSYDAIILLRRSF